MSSDKFGSRFGSALSKVLYVDIDSPTAVRPSAAEAEMVDAICLRIRSTDDRAALHSVCSMLETKIIPAITGESLLVLAQCIEANAPWMIENVPRLARAKAQLGRASDMAQAFSGENLTKLAAAIESEAARS